MSQSQLNGVTKAYGLALGIASILSVLLIIAKETNKGVFKMMQQITVHHWVTQGLFLVVMFLILGFILSKSRGGQGPSVSDAAVLNVAIGGVVLSAALIVLFYLMH